MYIHLRSLTASLPRKNGAWKTIAFPIGAGSGNFSGANSPKLPVRNLQVAPGTKRKGLYSNHPWLQVLLLLVWRRVYSIHNCYPMVLWSVGCYKSPNGWLVIPETPYRTPPLLILQSNTNSKKLTVPATSRKETRLYVTLCVFGILPKIIKVVCMDR